MKKSVGSRLRAWEDRRLGRIVVNGSLERVDYSRLEQLCASLTGFTRDDVFRMVFNAGLDHIEKVRGEPGK